MKASAMTLPQARLELALWQAEADMASSSNLYIRLTEMGLPSEVAIRLKELLEVVKPIGEKMVSIGKIIVLKLIEFIEKHPKPASRWAQPFPHCLPRFPFLVRSWHPSPCHSASRWVQLQDTVWTRHKAEE